MGLDSLIWIVDDNLDDISFIRDGLLDAGFTRIVDYMNGDQVIHAVREADELPALIFLDNRLPLVDGYGVIQAIKKHIDSGKIQVCLMTSLKPEWFDDMSDVLSIVVKGSLRSTRDQIKQAAQNLLLHPIS